MPLSVSGSGLWISCQHDEASQNGKLVNCEQIKGMTAPMIGPRMQLSSKRRKAEPVGDRRQPRLDNCCKIVMTPVIRQTGLAQKPFLFDTTDKVRRRAAPVRPNPKRRPEQPGPVGGANAA